MALSVCWAGETQLTVVTAHRLGRLMQIIAGAVGVWRALGAWARIDSLENFFIGLD
ncbi:hypothetical protein MELE44368_08390 [Mycolicibacterium elephantis DSM 44368]|uniref:Uncharacterized protein n=1 Tax=Mycolicibacterium elephantis DSM 44368 TaxID=1335622 RepID=A0A439DMH6_9MYCO|nr:hypothetical protein MELE44368_08390 [Mycolicibacterium elephantis DSM 44368]